MGEVKSVVEIGMDDYLSLLLREKEVAFANEMVLDKVTREGTCHSQIKIDIKRIVPDYFNDKSVLEICLALKALCCDICRDERDNRA